MELISNNILVDIIPPKAVIVTTVANICVGRGVWLAPKN